MKFEAEVLYTGASSGCRQARKMFHNKQRTSARGKEELMLEKSLVTANHNMICYPCLSRLFICARVTNMGGDDDDKWFVAGGRSRAKKRQDTNNSRGGTLTVGVGADISRGGNKKCFKCQGVGHLQHQCPLIAGAASSRGKQTAGGHYGSSSNVSTAASTSSGGSRKPPPPKKHPRAGPSGGGGKHGSQAASNSEATTKGCKRARDPTTSSGLTTPINRGLEARGSPMRRWKAASEWCW